MARAEEGFTINIWSARGERAAIDAVARCNLGGIVNATLSKPGIVVDDLGWDWTQYTRTIDPTSLTYPAPDQGGNV